MNTFRKLGFLLALTVSLALGSVGNVVKAESNQDVPRSVVSIDAGRKYFSETQLKQIIDRAYKNGYTSVQILLGNDGLRFVLDDMTIEVDGTVYDSEAVIEGIKKGNEYYYDDPNGNVLTEAEMDRILAYAKERKIDIIPVINSPGHMDAILVAMEELGMEDVRYTNGDKVSERTVNIENKQAIAFVQELVKVYAEYFGNSGASEFFNFGADEYANDVFTSPGWGELQRLGLYGDFVDYANTLSKIIKDAGMLPMSFNDGIYYNSEDSYGKFDQDIIISYWTAGWWGFYVAGPEYFVEKGHNILNTNDHWYWVLGNIDEGGYPYKNAVANTKKIPFNQLTNGSTVPTIGSMQAIWADDPSKPHDMDRIMNLLDLFSETHSDYLIRPADYTAVEEALEKVPESTWQYTDTSRLKLEEAIASVEKALRFTEQDKVNAMAKAIEEAITSLELKSADYTAIDDIVKKVEALDRTLYENFDDVLEEINNVDYDLTIIEQDKVDAMAQAIEEAVRALEYREADYRLVEEAIEKASQLNPEDYRNFEIVEEAIAEVKENLDIRYQESVNAMAKNIEDAIGKLEKKVEVEKPTEDGKEVEKPTEDGKEVEKPTEDGKEVEKPIEDDKDVEIPNQESVLPQTGQTGLFMGLTPLLVGLSILLSDLRKRK